MMKLRCLSILLILAFTGIAFSQSGGHTLYGDVKVDESRATDAKALSLSVLLYLENGNLLSRLTIPGNGRYRFLNLRDGRYEVVIEIENVEVARVPVSIHSPFRNDFRQDIELQLTDIGSHAKPQVISAADTYNRNYYNLDLFRRALDASGKKHYEEAIGFLRQLTARDPADFPAWQELGTVYFIQKNFVDAEKAFSEALGRNPNYLVTLISLGRLRIVLKNFTGALDVLNHALQIDSTSAQAYYFGGEAYLQLKLGSKAVPYLQAALRLDPVGMADAHLRLAALYNAKGLKDRAAAEYSEFLKVQPDYPEKKKLKEYIAANKKP